MGKNARKAGESPHQRRYERPTLCKRERLAEVTEGVEVTVTDGRPPVKGGCFERARE